VETLVEAIENPLEILSEKLKSMFFTNSQIVVKNKRSYIKCKHIELKENTKAKRHTT
jgi:hypothetical protein